LDAWLLPKLARFNQKSTWVVEAAYYQNEMLGLNTKFQILGHCGFEGDELKVWNSTKIHHTQANLATSFIGS
jgi:hypothetical protein